MKPSKILATLTLLGLVGVSAPAFATSIAVIDSGTDLSHPDLVKKQWTNPGDPDDGVDNDDNGYIDDTHGWNFAEGNNKLYDKRLVGKFSSEITKFFDVQTRMLRGSATADDRTWLDGKRKDAKFIGELGLFGNWVHGTHVAGISARDADKAEIMGIKIIPTKADAYLNEHAVKGMAENSMTASSRTARLKKKLVLMALNALADAQGKNFVDITNYVREMKPRLANCSFGTSVAQIKTILGPLLKKVLGNTTTDAEIDQYCTYFIEHTMQGMSGFVDRNKQTLFVIAAGNDGTNNDVLPASPANLKRVNTITVAATMGTNKLAVFSNFGTKTVDIAAPGVGIRSSIPGNEYLLLSGTSQATPFVTNLAGRIWDTNPNLSISEVKTLLMETVDKKDFLKDKVKAGGIANTERALFAAQMTLSRPMNEALEMSRVSVKDMPSASEIVDDQSAFIAPMMGLIR